MSFKVGDKVFHRNRVWIVDSIAEDWEAWDYWIVPSWREYSNLFGVDEGELRAATPLEELL